MGENWIQRIPILPETSENENCQSRLGILQPFCNCLKQETSRMRNSRGFKWKSQALHPARRRSRGFRNPAECAAMRFPAAPRAALNILGTGFLPYIERGGGSTAPEPLKTGRIFHARAKNIRHQKRLRAAANSARSPKSAANAAGSGTLEKLTCKTFPKSPSTH